jgi:leucyl aminopeptidase (aminopeptidase T)
LWYRIEEEIMSEGKMISSALHALREVFYISAEDKVLTLYDTHSENIARAFMDAAKSLNCETESYVIDEEERPLQDIPAELAELSAGKTIVLNILRAYPDEIDFRIKWLLRLEEGKNIRCAHMPGITEAMMTGGPMDVDYAGMLQTASIIIDALKESDRVHITTGRGTDLILGVSSRIFTHDVFVQPGGNCNLPCGEVYCAPEETKADGIVIFDASIGDIGMLGYPLKVHLEKGKVISFESEDEDLVKRIETLSSVDEEARIIGELGIGINPGARITGNMLEDEKALHTAHIAFGNNADFPGGGENHSAIHRDYLFYKPTIEAIFKNGSRRLIMNRGEFVPD